MIDGNAFSPQAKPDRARKELCVFCGRETEYLRTKPIDERFFYVEGAGQLCPDCYRTVFYSSVGEKKTSF